MLAKRIGDLSAADVAALVGNVPESKYLEYKSTLPGGQDSDRKEFVADVTAFANAGGGHIVFGLAEDEDAVAVDIIGVSVASRDAEERRLGEMIRNGTEPRFGDFEFRWIDIEPKSTVLVLRIAQSWRAPHRVTLKAHDKFYVRDGRGKHPMNTDELRASFDLANSLSDKILKFRRERVSLIAAGETPVPMNDEPKIILHIISIASYGTSQTITFNDRDLGPAPLGSSGFSTLQTLEGLVSYSGPEFSEEPVRAYTLQFRNGILEAVDSIGRENEQFGKRVFIGRAEQTLVSDLPAYFRYLTRHGLPLPYFLFVSITGVRNGVFATKRDWDHAIKRPLRRDDLLLPEMRFVDSDLNRPIELVMRPIFDLMWNSFGYPKSLNFNSDGQFEPWT